ncbi:type VI secretion system tip protein VgrG [candidate division KSB1 bacterium]|nr:type VI secretion system tip protein VgrG [candidate division KSB1 bacterium]
MPKFDASKAQLFLEIGDLPADTFMVVDFQGAEQISQLFQFEINLISEDEAVDFAAIINKTTRLIIKRGNDDIVLCGMISKFNQRGRSAEYVAYHATFVPRFWQLTLFYQSRIFQNMTVQDIVAQVLKDAGFSADDFAFNLSKSYNPREYCVQYQETDWNFICRLLEYEGIFFYFDHSGEPEKLTFSDDSTQAAAIEGESCIGYKPEAGLLTEQETIGEFTYEEQVVTKKVTLKDYNYRTPTVNMQGDYENQSDGVGIFYNYGDHFKTADEGKKLAKVRGEAMECHRKLFYGRSDCRGFRTGYKFSLKDHYRTDLMDVDYLLTAIYFEGSQAAGFGFETGAKKEAPNFQCRFECIPVNVPFRPPRNTPVPKLYGVMNSLIETAGGDYAYIDDQGQYHVKMPFDLSKAGNGRASRPVRLIEAYSGPNYGIHFPVHANTEMLWTCIDGDVDRPIAVGMASNPSNQSPVVANNKSQNIIRTKAGNEIILDDMIDEAQISITTPDANKMVFNDKDDHIVIRTTNNHEILMDDKNENIKIQTKDGHFMIMDDKNTKITLQSKNGHFITINDKSGSEKITVSDSAGENSITIDISNSKLVIKTDNGDIDIHAPNGTIDIKATTLNVETSGDTSFKAANINSEAQTDHNMKATNITAEAQTDFSQKGMNVTSEASKEHKSKGMNVTVEAGLKNEVKGTMTTVQASGVLTVQGSLVKIN